MMTSNLRIEELRQLEMNIIQNPTVPESVRARSIENCELLSELLTYREMMERVPQVKITLTESERELAATVAETGASPEIVGSIGGAGLEMIAKPVAAVTQAELWGEQ